MTSQSERGELEQRLAEASRALADLEARREAAERVVLAETIDEFARLSQSNAALERTIATLVAERVSNTARADQLRAVGVAAGWIRALKVLGWTLGLTATGLLAFHDGKLAAVASLAGLVFASLPVWRR